MVAYCCAAACAFVVLTRARRHHRARYARPRTIIVDGHTGKILHSSAADEARYPASLTKVMTLYLTFEAMHAGRITSATELNVSAHAASQDPTKLDLEAGDKITVRTLSAVRHR
jgi:D-alanyl-D-alanine carboxypeptidase